MNKKTVTCPKCGAGANAYSDLPIATCPKCGKVIRVETKDDPRRQKPQQPGDQKPL